MAPFFSTFSLSVFPSLTLMTASSFDCFPFLSCVWELIFDHLPATITLAKSVRKPFYREIVPDLQAESSVSRFFQKDIFVVVFFLKFKMWFVRCCCVTAITLNLPSAHCGKLNLALTISAVAVCCKWRGFIGSSYKCYLEGVTEKFLPLPLTKKESNVQAILSLPATKTLIKNFF